jgi:hypothetical protein
MASLYDLGEGLYIRATFADPVTGVPADPAEVRVKYLRPSDPVDVPVEKIWPADPLVIHDGPGAFSLLLTASEEGYWQYRWEGANVAPAVQEGSFIVRGSDLA